jgi:hypothetical protein
MDITKFLALLGAILSTIAITWNIFRDVNDKGKLKIDAIIGKIVPDHTDKDYLVITITNIGRRPVLVKSWGGMKKKNVKGARGIFITSRGLPRMLKEGEYHMEFTEDLSIIFPELEKIHVWDSTGKEWKISKKNLKCLFKDVQKINPDKN